MQRETYKLNFSKVNIPNWGLRYSCTQSEITNDSYFLAALLNDLSNREPEYLLEEITNTINGQPYEEYYSIDGSTLGVGVQTVPPNAIINQAYTISLTQLKALLEEWIAFCNS